MPNELRFFFVFSNSLTFPLVFIFGIIFVPLTCGLRYLCVKNCNPKEPERNVDPVKPTKPIEPKIGENTETWDNYRKSLKEYRDKKNQWKESRRTQRENQGKLLNDYDDKQRDYEKKTAHYKAKVLMPARRQFCDTFKLTTTQIIFFKDEIQIGRAHV